jgi:hypothetical protein
MEPVRSMVTQRYFPKLHLENPLSQRERERERVRESEREKFVPSLFHIFSAQLHCPQDPL